MTTEQEQKPETRKAYRQRREAQIQELAARLDLWEAKAKKAAAKGEIRYREELESLRQKLETARVRISLLKDASEDAWKDLRGGLDEAVDDLKRAVKKAASKFE